MIINYLDIIKLDSYHYNLQEKCAQKKKYRIYRLIKLCLQVRSSQVFI